ALVIKNMKPHGLMNDENPSTRIAEVCNNVRFSDLPEFCRDSKPTIMKCYNK
ncbi:hypothetical protein BDC45DRAFT_420389, partial [Circinella umbellata]